jgi:hypothetical protein
LNKFTEPLSPFVLTNYADFPSAKILTLSITCYLIPVINSEYEIKPENSVLGDISPEAG